MSVHKIVSQPLHDILPFHFPVAAVHARFFVADARLRLFIEHIEPDVVFPYRRGERDGDIDQPEGDRALETVRHIKNLPFFTRPDGAPG